MARTRSPRINEIKAKLTARIRDGFHRPGDPFISNRALADRDEISYQTAHRLLEELVAEGWLERRASSGTFIAGKASCPKGVQFVFANRAKSPGSFGASLLHRLMKLTKAAQIPALKMLAGETLRLRPDYLPVFWECGDLVTRMANERRFCILLQDSPPPGLGASYVDCVRTDDYSGGVCAAQVLLKKVPFARRLTVVAGPEQDLRSSRRVNGFRSLVPEARIIQAKGWYLEHGRACAASVLERPVEGVFCCNDRLAQGLLEEFEARGIASPPYVVGYDNAPIAEALHLTTIAIPWDQFAQETLALVRNRLEGDSSPARQIILALRPHIRLTA